VAPRPMAKDTASESSYRGFSEIADYDPIGKNRPHLVHPATGAIVEFAKRASKGTLTEAVEKSARWDHGHGLFRTFDDKIQSGVAAAYPAFLHLMEGGKEATSEVLSRADFPERQRRPKKGTEALVAVMLVAKTTRRSRTQEMLRVRVDTPVGRCASGSTLRLHQAVWRQCQNVTDLEPPTSPRISNARFRS
jgi:hypothetical protein